MARRARTVSFEMLSIALLLAIQLAPRAFGGPDHSPLSYCSALYSNLSFTDRHAARVAVQALQAVQSYLGHLQLGRPLPLSSVKEAAPSMATEAAAALAGSCLSSRLVADSFAGRPVVSVLLNYFKRPQVINRVVTDLRKSCAAVGVPCELVVNVDNPHEAAAWAAEVEGGFVVPVFSANVHESRGYNRAAKVARGRYLVVWQDDQLPPQSGQWLIDMARVFDAHPALAILGMNTYRLCKLGEVTNRFGLTNWAPDDLSGVKWTFAEAVDFAPLAIRASIFADLGGLDEGLSRPGDCGIWGDWELCARAWMGGWQVGYMYMDGRSGDGQPGGTHSGSSAEKCWGRQQHVTSHVFQKRYHAAPIQEDLCGRVWLLNMLAFRLPASRGTCPYRSFPTLGWGNCSQPSEEARAELSAFLALQQPHLQQRRPQQQHARQLARVEGVPGRLAAGGCPGGVRCGA
ncbi:hypothetical protein TSOC_003328, partial [Tetrabaena socialis]